jgi:hypothetical protein
MGLQILLILSLLIGTWGYASHALEESYRRSHDLLNAEGKPTALLLEILRLGEIQHDGSLPSIVAATQAHWVRPKNLERWQIPPRFLDRTDAFRKLFEKTALFHRLTPTLKHYDYVLVLGATLTSMRTRVRCLKAFFEEGSHFDQLVFLGCPRPLDPVLEGPEALTFSSDPHFTIRADWSACCPLPQTEMAMMEWVWDQADLPLQLRNIKTLFCNTPMKVDGSATRRPNTGDTILQWLSNKPAEGTCLVISSQPFAGYQDACIRTLLPFLYETVSLGTSWEKVYEGNGDRTVAILLDNLAGWLDAELRWFESQKSIRL